jgi:2,4-dienoyl-CoA reductase-like NADH-dependent reductase (Old Yellow Enzyme family)
MSSYPTLFSPVRLGPVELRNRVAMLPHTTLYPVGGRPNSRHRHYYEERALGGVGLVIAESHSVEERGASPLFCNASDREGMALWAETLDAVHSHGTKMFAQLSWFGADGTVLDSMRPLLGPSGLASPSAGEATKPMDAADMERVRSGFAAGARNLLDAGFDGVEVKIGHDGMLRHFLSPYFNRRTDEYGGSHENRARFPIEVLRAIRAEVGEDRALGIRLGLYESFPGGYELEDGLEFARLLNATGLFDYVTGDLGTIDNMGTYLVPSSVPEGFAVDALASLREVVDVPVIGFGRIKKPAQAEEMLAAGSVDVIGMARQLIADPQWVAKAAAGNAEAIRPCVACNQECIGRAIKGMAISCVHNPAAGREAELGARTLRPASPGRRVVVVGGGPAGLKTAEVAAERGHAVTLIERSAALGGQVRLASGAPGHEEWGQIVGHLIRRVDELGVTVELGTEATAEHVAGLDPEAIVLATGSGPAPWPFEVEEGAVVLNEWQVLGEGAPTGKVVLVDHGVRFESAALAEAIVEAGGELIWVAAGPSVGPEIVWTHLPRLLAHLGEKGARRMPERVVQSVGEGTVRLADVYTGAEETIDGVAAVVVAGNKVREDSLRAPLAAAAPTFLAIGDCVAPRHTAIAIYEGEVAARSI